MKRKLNQLFTHVHLEILGENELMAQLDFDIVQSFFLQFDLFFFFCNMPIYFALEGIVGSGKMILLKWFKVMLLEDGHTFYMIPKPVDKFKKKITYNPLEECYKCPTQSAAMAQIHIMNESVKHYTKEVTKVQKMKLDLVLSERSIVSLLIFTDAYFHHDIFSAFTKDSIDMMWGDETGNDVALADVKPDVIIFLKVPAREVRSRLRNEPTNSSWSEVEHEFLIKNNLSTFLYHHESACQRFMEATNIPHHVVELDRTVTPLEAAQ